MTENSFFFVAKGVWSRKGVIIGSTGVWARKSETLMIVMMHKLCLRTCFDYTA